MSMPETGNVGPETASPEKVPPLQEISLAEGSQGHPLDGRSRGNETPQEINFFIPSLSTRLLRDNWGHSATTRVYHRN
jgi:hypothetical protein